MKNIPSLSALRLSTLIAGLGALGFVPSISAAILYWDGEVDSTWGNVANWSTASGATTPNPAAIPTSADDIVFNITTLNATVATTHNNNMAANSLTFNNTGTSRISSNNSSIRQFELGAGGVTVNAGAGVVNLGNNSATVRFGIVANQTWANNSSSSLILVNAGGAANTGTDAVTLTLTNTGSGNTTFQNAVQDGTAGRALSLVVNSSGTGLVNLSNSTLHTYSGGTTVQRGVFVSNSHVIGLGNVNLSATATHTAVVRVTSANVVANNFVSSGASDGTNLLEFTGTSGTLDGDITLENNLNVGVRLSDATGVTINGDISGTGDLIKGQYQSGNSGLLILAGTNTYTGDTIIDNGAFTLSDIGSLTFSIGADGVNNQVTGTSTGAISFAGDFNFSFGLDAFVDGNSWTIVDRSALSNVSFAGTFGINGFTETADDSGIWTNGSGFTFTESDGVLTYAIPEPSSFALLAGAAVLGLGALRRRRAV